MLVEEYDQTVSRLESSVFKYEDLLKGAYDNLMRVCQSEEDCTNEEMIVVFLEEAVESAEEELSDFEDKYEEVNNLMSGKPIMQPKDTPLCCDVSSETYWCM